ncbi:unnamed protein product [Lactuca saligna]|uniref:Uncharacterized protein n=1 Tax=Lactuca saligna TaxID=75948 RepID=A0AA35ZGR7_LACSI|nr:unnamed protein product [Lactuca saligna]
MINEFGVKIRGEYEKISADCSGTLLDRWLSRQRLKMINEFGVKIGGEDEKISADFSGTPPDCWLSRFLINMGEDAHAKVYKPSIALVALFSNQVRWRNQHHYRLIIFTCNCGICSPPTRFHVTSDMKF